MSLRRTAGSTRSFRPFGGEKSLSIVVEEGSRIRIIYTNQAGSRWMKNIDFPTLEDISNKANQYDMPIHKAMRTCFDRLHRPGEVAACEVDDPSFGVEMEVALINESGCRRGFLVSCMDENRKDS